jgi:hypothetical protein
MALENHIARCSFGPEAVKAIAEAFERLLTRLEIARDDSLAHNVAAAVINAAAEGITDSDELQARAMQMLASQRRVA